MTLFLNYIHGWVRSFICFFYEDLHIHTKVGRYILSRTEVEERIEKHYPADFLPPPNRSPAQQEGDLVDKSSLFDHVSALSFDAFLNHPDRENLLHLADYSDPVKAKALFAIPPSAGKYTEEKVV